MQRDKFRRENVNFCCVLDLKCTGDVKVRLEPHLLVKRVHTQPHTHTHTHTHKLTKKETPSTRFLQCLILPAVL